MGNPAGVRRDFAALEERRMEAARLLKEGLSQSEVARVVGVHRQSVSRWARELEQSGMRGLRKAKHTGRRAKLSSAQLRRIEHALKRGPEAFGFATGLWTASRVRDLIEYRSGVRYHEDHVWRILRKLNWTCQRPTGKALERDEQAIRQWKKYRWPKIKKKRSANGAPSSSSTKTDWSERPHRVRTWAPRGQTPVLQYHFNWKVLSASAGITWWNFYFRLYPTTICAPQVVDFLGHLPRHLAGKLLRCGDGLPAHRARSVSDFHQRSVVGLQSSGCRVTPLNSIQWSTSGVTGSSMNCPTSVPATSSSSAVMPDAICPRDFIQLSRHARRALARMRRRPTLVMAFWEQAELFPL